MSELQDCLDSLRKRIRELRIADNDKVSIHILSVEIALSLTEFALRTTPPRAIDKSEEKWFEAGRFVELILGHSEWEDIVENYYKLIDSVREKNYFRISTKS
jgi:hypothetical protein